MRKFRNAAIAGMTALTLVAGAHAPAFAAEDAATTPPAEATSQEDAIKEGPAAPERETPKPQNEVCDITSLDLSQVNVGDRDCVTRDFDHDLKDYLKNPSNSSVWGKRYAGDKDVVGTDLLGLNKDFGRQPVWAQIWYVVTVLGVVGTVIGIGALPILNSLKAKGIII